MFDSEWEKMACLAYFFLSCSREKKHLDRIVKSWFICFPVEFLLSYYVWKNKIKKIYLVASKNRTVKDVLYIKTDF